MRDINIDGRLQVIASVSLLRHSRLVQWEGDPGKFSAVSREVFESDAKQVDSQFGRLICWMSFSAGAEFLAKGVCLLRGVEIRNLCKVPAYPTGDLASWVAKYKIGAQGTVDVTNFGQLGNIWNGKLQQLSQAVHASPEEEKKLLVAYELLTRSIRNRDAHAYVPSVRDQHFNLVSELFSECFNLLVSWIPGAPNVLNTWLDDAAGFIASL